MYVFVSNLYTSFFCQVIFWGRTEKCLKETAEEISLSGTECHYFLCDVANREEVYKQAMVVREKVHQLNIGKKNYNLHTVTHFIKYFFVMPVSYICILALSCSFPSGV